jgi:hypothetical protein
MHVPLFHARCCLANWQIEMRDMRVRLLLALMATDDAVGAVQADAAVNECMANMLSHNYGLYAGRNEVPATRDQDAATVRMVFGLFAGVKEAYTPGGRAHVA